MATILEREFGVSYTRNGVCCLLHCLGYSCLAPRPRHENFDPGAETRFRQEGPFLPGQSGTRSNLATRLRTFFFDEARFGQMGTLTRVWARRGSRPTAVRQTKYEWCYLYAAVEPATGQSTALLAPEVNVGAMELFLGMLSADLGAKDHALLVMDRAGRHTSVKLAIPDNVTVLLLPPYSPELNPVERLWLYLREHHLANRTYAGYDELLDAGCDAWQRLTPELLRSVCRCDYLNDDAIGRAN